MDETLYLRVENSALIEALRDTARNLGFTYMGAQGFAGAVLRAVDRAAAVKAQAVVAALRARGVDEDAVQVALDAVQREPSLPREVNPVVCTRLVKVIAVREGMAIVASDLGLHRMNLSPGEAEGWLGKVGERAVLEEVLIPVEGTQTTEKETA